MPNHSVFNPQNQPVFTLITNAYSSPGTVAPPETSAGSNGSMYISTASNSSSLGLLGGSVTITLQISNPGSSGKTLYVSRIAGGTGISLNLLSSFSANFTLIKGGTLTSPTSASKLNTNFSSANVSVMTANSSTSAVSGGTAFFALPVNAGQFALEQTGSIVVPAGQSIAATLSASLSVAGVLSTTLNIAWWEA
ncbi:hypothetical protein SK3146_04007 [Paenibacillus konkukensis]|uniref:Uncharacterized protein n=1 Tax=Paenibacillus konkukensis TaxID=2020716 RepID=A0ABY4RS14_9BACL|nr:hypothetical protein [Paenibacillus konkukensis]UQZ84752.1 hypothetical protein SK3146_04007 [Paenibacillus konkukensis]